MARVRQSAAATAIRRPMITTGRDCRLNAARRSAANHGGNRRHSRVDRRRAQSGPLKILRCRLPPAPILKQRPIFSRRYLPNPTVLCVSRYPSWERIYDSQISQMTEHASFVAAGECRCILSNTVPNRDVQIAALFALHDPDGSTCGVHSQYRFRVFRQLRRVSKRKNG